LLFLAALSGVACNQNANLGWIGDGSASLLWHATFEPGDLSEWLGDGQGGIYADNTLTGPYASRGVPHHGGAWAGVMTVEPSASMNSLAYLYRQQPSPPTAYYSAWFYVPSTITLPVPGAWLSLCHFRGMDPVDAGAGRPASYSPLAHWDVNLYQQADGSLAAQLFDYKAQRNTSQLQTLMYTVPFPTDQWVQLEVLFTKSSSQTGRIVVWQNGAKILWRDAADTLLNSWLQWDVGAAANYISPPAASIYMDDAAISTIPLGHSLADAAF
jgi:hypothetical protein